MTGSVEDDAWMMRGRSEIVAKRTVPWVPLVLLLSGCAAGKPAPALGKADPRGAEAKTDLSDGGTVLLIGDSILDSGKGDARVERVISAKLQVIRPGTRWDIVNLARGGMWIGPANADGIKGVARPLFDPPTVATVAPTTGWYFEVRKRCPKAAAVFVLFSANDSKVYPPAVFRRKFEALTDRLRADYPGAKVFLMTSMYLDPKHSSGHYQQPSMVDGFVQGDSRNVYLTPYFAEVRDLARVRGLTLVDLRARLKAETESGNWDLRVRDDGTQDDSKDAAHPGDMKWFNNIHPNRHGTEVIADLVVHALIGR